MLSKWIRKISLGMSRNNFIAFVSKTKEGINLSILAIMSILLPSGLNKLIRGLTHGGKMNKNIRKYQKIIFISVMSNINLPSLKFNRSRDWLQQGYWNCFPIDCQYVILKCLLTQNRLNKCRFQSQNLHAL